MPQEESGVLVATDQPIILLTAGGSVNGAVATVIKLKTADLEKMSRLRRLVLKLKKPLRLERTKS